MSKLGDLIYSMLVIVELQQLLVLRRRWRLMLCLSSNTYSKYTTRVYHLRTCRHPAGSPET